MRSESIRSRERGGRQYFTVTARESHRGSGHCGEMYANYSKMVVLVIIDGGVRHWPKLIIRKPAA